MKLAAITIKKKDYGITNKHKAVAGRQQSGCTYSSYHECRLAEEGHQSFV